MTQGNGESPGGVQRGEQPTRAPKAWNGMISALVQDLPRSLSEAARLRQAMLRRRRLR